MSIKVMIFISIIAIIMSLIIYTIIDNKRIKVVRELIKIDGLPKEFQGYKILQITDLHCKTFGKNQGKLLNIINSIDYDIIAITGDMGSRHTTDISPFTDLLDGIKNKENIFYVQGNNGPESIKKIKTGKGKEKKVYYEITEVGKFLQEKGCKLLEKPYPIKRGKETLWISKFLNKDVFYDLEPRAKIEDKKIVITHYPMNKYFYKKIAPPLMANYDLVIAGHYHGGQYRIPFYGAFFVPDSNGSNGLWPEQYEVSGLNTWGSFKQYTSRGLGASCAIKMLEFRLFNTPEINLLTLTSYLNESE
ncbi:metallophosphoesterase [Clostridium sp.]|uniref:metallophosphoesterase n=1 Tax=Clostridium sp. TaxID=1506 RepID=UPI003F38BF63